MHFLLGSTAKDIPGPDIAIDCLWCEQQTNAHSWQRVEWLMLFHILPVIPFKTVFVKCASCDKEMVAKCSLEELRQSSPVTLKYILSKRVSFVGRVCIILGWLFCWTPFCGLIPAIIGFIYGRKMGAQMKKIAFWGLILNLFSPLIFALLVIFIRAIFK